jgi:hypothetical protein
MMKRMGSSDARIVNTKMKAVHCVQYVAHYLIGGMEMKDMDSVIWMKTPIWT